MGAVLGRMGRVDDGGRRPGAGFPAIVAAGACDHDPGLSRSGPRSWTRPSTRRDESQPGRTVRSRRDGEHRQGASALGESRPRSERIRRRCSPRALPGGGAGGSGGGTSQGVPFPGPPHRRRARGRGRRCRKGSCDDSEWARTRGFRVSDTEGRAPRVIARIPPSAPSSTARGVARPEQRHEPWRARRFLSRQRTNLPAGCKPSGGQASVHKRAADSLNDRVPSEAHDYRVPLRRGYQHASGGGAMETMALAALTLITAGVIMAAGPRRQLRMRPGVRAVKTRTDAAGTPGGQGVTGRPPGTPGPHAQRSRRASLG